MAPTTRSSARKSQEGGLNTSIDVASSDGHASPRYRTRSQAKSLPDSGVFESPGRIRFPFFDESNNNTSRDYNIHQPALSRGRQSLGSLSPMMDSAGIGADLSPIKRSRESDASDASLSLPSDNASGEENLHGILVQERIQAKSTESMMKNEEHNLLNDLSSARRQVGQSSNDFIERIRSAAHKRKVEMTRSRDSLVAKEEEQLRSNAEARAKSDEEFSKTAGKERLPRNDVTVPRKQVATAFRARPLPATTGIEGSGGLDGIPKVAKKPTTVPFSPQLGVKRKGKIEIKALRAPKMTQMKTEAREPAVRRESPRLNNLEPPKDVIRPFKARPIPEAVGARGYGGQYGVPKVQKRPVTVPCSPLLGPRRQRGSFQTKAELSCTTQKGEGDYKTHIADESLHVERLKSGSSVQSPSLLGLDILDLSGTRSGKIAVDESPGDENSPPQDHNLHVFQPRSSNRAKKRAVYDKQKESALRSKSLKNAAKRDREIRRLRRELQVLKQEI